MVISTYGQEKWDEILHESSANDNADFFVFHRYEDEMTDSMFQLAASILNMPFSTLLESFGTYFYGYAVDKRFADTLFILGRDLETFLENLDFHHNFGASFIFGASKIPSFRTERFNDTLLLHYYSARRHYAPMVKGLVREVAKEVFNISVEPRLVEDDPSNVSCSVVGPNLSHAVFCLDGYKPSIIKPRKHAMWQADYCFLTRCDFQALMPYHIIFDEHMVIRDVGNHLSAYYEQLLIPNIKINSAFRLLRPSFADFTAGNIRSLSHCTFELQLIDDASHRPGPRSLELKGQMISLEKNNMFLFACSPKLDSLDVMKETGLFLSDLSVYDATRELVLLNQQRKTDVELSQKVEEVTETLQHLAGQLKAEKAKTDMLLHEMLPKAIAKQLKEGKTIEAGNFSEVTILFSDIVTFTVIASHCAPSAIVNMLNELFTRFDELSVFNDVYKVETIGDAYMVASGVPEPEVDHAEKVTNMGLGMIALSTRVRSPYDESAIKIRVGIHTGPAMAGVVGRRMPRYCLFGDTVNTASRMESHGIPDRVHASKVVVKALKNHDFAITSRGVVMIKGKGRMQTYFIDGNRNKSETRQLVGDALCKSLRSKVSCGRLSLADPEELFEAQSTLPLLKASNSMCCQLL